ncbi:MAG: hypothetical protein ACOH5I_20515 [Oligoflexus sp.]
MKKIILPIFFMTSLSAFADTPGNQAAAGAAGAQYTTKMDFDSSMIDGKMKAPSGFFLQGRNRQDLQSMVRLRSNFREKLEDSRSAVKAMVR